MKLITIFLTAGLVFTAAAQSDSKDEKKPATKAVPVPAQPVIPKDATPLPDGSFRYVDKDGKKWIYRTTPFGVSKAEEHPAPPVAQIVDDPAKSEDLGDSVRFTRPTPFGPKVWTTKKSQLDTYEKNIFDRDQRRQSGAPSQGSDASKSDTHKQQD
jgi:hypothetical protein